MPAFAPLMYFEGPRRALGSDGSSPSAAHASGQECRQGVEGGDLGRAGRPRSPRTSPAWSRGRRSTSATCQLASSPWCSHGPTAQPGIAATASWTAAQAASPPSTSRFRRSQRRQAAKAAASTATAMMGSVQRRCRQVTAVEPVLRHGEALRLLTSGVPIRTVEPFAEAARETPRDPARSAGPGRHTAPARRVGGQRFPARRDLAWPGGTASGSP